MSTAIETGQDVITFLELQHQQIKQLFGEVRASSGEQRERTFTETFHVHA